ncbi:hypothetical protein LXA43DRAFT_60561 [Ganoderma leucocontextum]|nr:hypothetical protein LXA43DRAFT_60561 [Ganoderma leucocontextum]
MRRLVCIQGPIYVWYESMRGTFYSKASKPAAPKLHGRRHVLPPLAHLLPRLPPRLLLRLLLHVRHVPSHLPHRQQRIREHRDHVQVLRRLPVRTARHRPLIARPMPLHEVRVVARLEPPARVVLPVPRVRDARAHGGHAELVDDGCAVHDVEQRGRGPLECPFRSWRGEGEAGAGEEVFVMQSEGVDVTHGRGGIRARDGVARVHGEVGGLSTA